MSGKDLHSCTGARYNACRGLSELEALVLGPEELPTIAVELEAGVLEPWC